MNISVFTRRATLAFAAIFAMAFALGAAQDKPAAEGPQPKMVVPVREYNAGKINKGGKVEHEFIIRNTGKGTLIIENAKPSCGCTVPTFDKEVSPGGQGVVKASVNTANLGYGPTTKHITVTTNDPVEPNFKLDLSMDLTAAIRVLPKENVVFNARAGEGAEQKIVLHAEEGKPFEVRSVMTDSEFLDAKYEKVSGKMTEVAPNLVASKDDYIVTVTLTRNAPAGYLAGRKVVIKTDSKDMPEVDVRVSARITEPGKAETTPSGS